MKKYSLYTVVFLVFLVLVGIAFISISLSVTQHRKDFLNAAIEDKIHLAKTLNETTASPLWFYKMSLIPGVEKAFLDGMAKFKDVVCLRIVGPDGKVYQSSIEEEWGKIIEEPAIAQALQTKKPIVKDGVCQGEKLKTITYPGYEGKAIWVAFSLKSVEEATKSILLRDIAVSLGALLFTLFFVFMILRRITNPLKKMTATCQEIRKGNLDVKMPAISETEIGELAITFNEMVEDLKESQTALAETKTALEVKVEARTRELKELTESLEEKVKDRTQQLQEKIKQLEKFNRLVVGRELKMIELKKEIERLKEELKERKD